MQLLLGAYVLGGLSAPEEAAVRAHLEGCAPCRAEHNELACVPSWLDLLAPAEAAGGLDLPGVPDRSPGEDRRPGRRDGAAGSQPDSP